MIVSLYTYDNRFVAQITVMPFMHWPQCFMWGERFFVRKDALDDISCTQVNPPDYYEITPVAIVPPFGGIVH